MNRTRFFKEKVVVITGASSGIGRELALSFTRSGARVALAARDEAKLDELQRRIGMAGGQAIAVKTDVAAAAEVEQLVRTVMEKWGRIDIYISNAGQYIQGMIKELDAEAFQDSFAVNFFGSFYAVNQLIPVMSRQRSGHIVFINSLDAKKGIVGDGPYVAAKAALDGFGDVLRQEMGDLGIKVMSVYPARVDTPMIGDLAVPRISAKMPVGKVARAVERGIMKNRAVVVVPGALAFLGALNDLAPRLTDRAYKLFRLEGKKSRHADSVFFSGVPGERER